MASLPLALDIERFDAPLTRESLSSEQSGLSARYYISLGGGGEQKEGEGRRIPVMCKLVDKVGPRVSGKPTGNGRKEKKVLVRVGGGFLDLESFCLGVLAKGL